MSNNSPWSNTSGELKSEYQIRLEEEEAAAKVNFEKRRVEEAKNREWRAQRYRHMLEGDTSNGHVINFAAMPRDAHEGNWPLGQVVHANSNTLDDRLSNLRMIPADMIAVIEMEIYRGWSKQTDKE
jgi:hypothetical protein